MIDSYLDNTYFFRWLPKPTNSWKKECKKISESLLNLSSSSTKNNFDNLFSEIVRLSRFKINSLQHLKLNRLSKILLMKKNKFEGIQKFNLGIISNKTVDFIQESLTSAGFQRNFIIEAHYAPYNSIIPISMGKINPFKNIKLDAVLMMIDKEFVDNYPSDKNNEVKIQKIIKEIENNLQTKIICSTVVNNFNNEVSNLDFCIKNSNQNKCILLNKIIREGAVTDKWFLWDQEVLANNIGKHIWFDNAQSYLSKALFSPRISMVVADSICRTVASIIGKTSKALIFDLDNTIWGGEIGDLGHNGINLGNENALGEAFSDFQKYILELKRRGIVLGICSKNNEDIAKLAFEKNKNIHLKLKDISIFQCNWNDKATNLKAISESLKLGLDSFVFVDDNPVERERVRQELPMVNVPEIGTDPVDFTSIITQAGYFEHQKLSKEDHERSSSYQQEIKRAQIKTQLKNYDEFLKSLKMKCKVEFFKEDNLDRITQLNNKTNQFNLTTRRYNKLELNNFIKNNNTFCFQFFLDDKFGSYGMISMVILEKERDSYKIILWLQSCRVLERSLENFIMNYLVKFLKKNNVKIVTGEFIPTAKNKIVEEHYENLGFQLLNIDKSKIKEYLLDLEVYKDKKNFIKLIK